ncbi:MAG: EAL domain-containing protein [Actinobacteria bacterium]|nr:EAL domain-containing protein [Actinomycetota bacterium]
MLAGFVLFPALVSLTVWRKRESPAIWIGTTVWALSLAGLAYTTVGLVVGAFPPDTVGSWLSVRTVLFAISLFSMFWMLQALAGRWFPVLTGVLAGILITRVVLWFTTDLIWLHTVNANDLPNYGPARGWFLLAQLLVEAALLVAVLSKRWKSAVARRATFWVMIPTVIVVAISPLLTSDQFEFVGVAILAIPVLILQAVLLNDLAQQYQQAKMRSERETRLAQFGREALTPGQTVPSQAAISLIVDVICPTYCEVVETSGFERRPVVTSGTRPTETGTTTTTIALESGGRTLGELVVVGPVTAEDSVFIRSVGLVLSASLARSEMEKQLRNQALHDAVTGLPNWALLQDRMARLCTRSGGRMVVVLCCDIHELRVVNDEYGHHVGDELLKEVGVRLTNLAIKDGTVARVSGDEFVVTQYVDDQDAADKLAGLATTISFDPLSSTAGPIRFDVRVGIAATRDPQVDPDRLVRDAEIALMRAKTTSTKSAAFDRNDRELGSARRKIVRSLSAAIKDNEIYVEYQPLVELSTRRVRGFEALARWRKPDGTTVPPLEFIPIAEANQMMDRLTETIFDQALAQAACWDEDDDIADLGLSLNITPDVIGGAAFVPLFTKQLQSHGIQARRITLELTESSLETPQEDVVRNLHALREMGLKISLDDFGTGYSTFDRMLKLPVQELKIDRSYTGIGPGPHRQIVTAVIDLAHRSELQVVAEGIETVEQLHMLVKDGCEIGQGYYFSRPMAGDAVSSYVRRSKLRLLDELGTGT